MCGLVHLAAEVGPYMDPRVKPESCCTAVPQPGDHKKGVEREHAPHARDGGHVPIADGLVEHRDTEHAARARDGGHVLIADRLVE